MQLPISAVVTIALVLIVLVALVVFFYATGGGAAARTELQKKFAEGCLFICSLDDPNDLAAVRLRYSAVNDWQRTCEQLHGVERGAYLQCLGLCGPTCASLPGLCDRLQVAAADVGADCPWLCEVARTNNATRGLYENCDCNCP